MAGKSTLIEKFKAQLRKTVADFRQEKWLVACSGGVDSVVLAHLCKEAGINFSLAHVNYHLRGIESDDDQQFVREMGEKFNTEVLIFDATSTDAGNDSKGVQEWARRIRYDWMEKQALTHGFDRIATAHHQDDQVETFFLQLLRGSGLRGVAGMKPVRQRIIRPLLGFSKEEILSYAAENKLKWREDSSNFSERYKRNQLRHKLLPLLEEIKPGYQKNIISFMQIMKAGDVVLTAVLNDFEMAHTVAPGKIEVPFAITDDEVKRETFFLWLRGNGFTQDESDRVLSINGSSGKLVDGQIFTCQSAAGSWHFYLDEIPEIPADPVIVDGPGEYDWHSYRIKAGDEGSVADPDCVLLRDAFSFPLVIRKWKAGDKFSKPGLHGRKKVSDFLSEQGLTAFDKGQVWVVESGEEILFVGGVEKNPEEDVTSGKLFVLKVERKA